MDLTTRFNIEDVVYYATQDLILGEERCEHCGSSIPGKMGPIRAVEAKVIGINIDVVLWKSAISSDSLRVNIAYVADDGNTYSEDDLFTTAEEALRGVADE